MDKKFDDVQGLDHPRQRHAMQGVKLGEFRPRVKARRAGYDTLGSRAARLCREEWIAPCKHEREPALASPHTPSPS